MISKDYQLQNASAESHILYKKLLREKSDSGRSRIEI
jgi:hypothetical protein